MSTRQLVNFQASAPNAHLEICVPTDTSIGGKPPYGRLFVGGVEAARSCLEAGKFFNDHGRERAPNNFLPLETPRNANSIDVLVDCRGESCKERWEERAFPSHLDLVSFYEKVEINRLSVVHQWRQEWTFPYADEFHAEIEKIFKHLAAGRNVLVFCINGQSRSIKTAMCVAFSLYELPLSQVEDFVKIFRGIADMAPHDDRHAGCYDFFDRYGSKLLAMQRNIIYGPFRARQKYRSVSPPWPNSCSLSRCKMVFSASRRRGLRLRLRPRLRPLRFRQQGCVIHSSAPQKIKRICPTNSLFS